MTVAEQIDELLRGSEDGDLIVLHSGQSELYFKAVDMAVAYNLIVKRGNTYDLTRQGYEVLESSGFEQWKRENKKREDEAHQATLDSAKATIDAAKSAKNSAKASWVSTAFAAVAVLFSIYQYTESIRLQSQINELKSEPKLLPQQSQGQKSSPIKSLSLVDSLPNPKKTK